MLNQLGSSLHELYQINFSLFTEIIGEIGVDIHQELASSLTNCSSLGVEDQVLEGLYSNKVFRISCRYIGADHIGVLFFDGSQNIPVELGEDALYAGKSKFLDS